VFATLSNGEKQYLTFYNQPESNICSYIDEPTQTEHLHEVPPTPCSSSTPVKSKKHKLGPSNLEPPKKKANLSGIDCKRRSEMMQDILKEKFVESPGKTTSHADVLDALQIDNKNLATRSVKQSFSSVVNDRRKGEYKNIRHAISYHNACESHSFEVHNNSDIYKLQQEVILHKEKAETLMDAIKTSVKDPYVSSLISLYNKEMDYVSTLTDNIDVMYEKELEFLMKRGSVFNTSEKSALVEEFEKLASIVNLGIRSGDNVADIELSGLLFENLKDNFEKNCPLLTELLHDLFPYNEKSDKKEKGAIHALSLLASLRNKQCRNDITLIFSLMLVSFGAGCRMINMLNKVGITLHWDTLMNFLDKQMEKKIDHVKSLTPPEIPLLLLMDNINIYRGNKRHHRLFKVYGQNMWNFTVRGLFIPQTDEINHLFTCRETACQSQHDVTKFTYADLTINNNKEHLRIWEDQVDNYLTQLLKDGLSFKTNAPFRDMSESDCNSCLKNKSYNISEDLKITLKNNINQSRSGIKSQTVILPLSLENNSTLAGSAVILDQFGKEFSIPSVSKVENLPFDTSTKAFCLKKAREHVEFNLIVSHHKGKAEHSHLSDDENDHEGQDFINDGGNDDGDEASGHEDDEFLPSDRVSGQETTLRSAHELFRQQDRTFNSAFDLLRNKLWNAIQTNDVDRFIKEVAENDHFRSVRDHLGRSLLHVAVEQQNINLVDCLIHAGVNPNVKELCGVTPLLIGVIVKNKEICKLLVEGHASVQGPLFSKVPSPLVAALRMELAEIYEILIPGDSEDEDDSIASYDPIFTRTKSSSPIHPTSENVEDKCHRATPGFITGVVGDVGTCKTNRGVISRADAYEWVGIIPGDLHTKGYLSEACFKEQGSGGFHYLVSKVLKRPKLTTDAFKKKKFSEGNLDRIREAVRDGARSYGLAAVFEFKDSDLYPSETDKQQCLRSTGSHTKVFLEHFKRWLERSRNACPSFRYRSRMFLFYGPLLELFDASTRDCWGKAREVSYILQLPIYAQLNFRNYYSECFIHVINFLGKWPLAFRNLLSNNCSINLSGKKSCGIELDAFVESEIVQPLKVYMSGIYIYI
jgi:hypothetical protein